MNPNDNTESFVRRASIRVEPAADQKVQEKMQDAYRQSSPAGAAVSRVGYWDLIFANRFARLGAAAIILLAVVSLAGEVGSLLSGGVAWADVTQRFQSVPFFYASIYVRQDALDEPRQFELWMGKGGDARMRVGSQVVFAKNGCVTRAFDVRARREVKADRTAADIIEMLATSQEFSLETVIRSISWGKLVDVTPAVNPHAAMGRDLAVFDAHSAVSPGWVRIYALRESRLPVGLRIWDPTEGFGVDALITYAREQPAVFFDPEGFAARLTDADAGDTGLAYMFLKDPGGQDITPGDVANQAR
jgi:hypothetical protein